MPPPHSSLFVTSSLRPKSSLLKSRSQNSSSDLLDEPTVASTTWRPFGDQRMVLVERFGSGRKSLKFLPLSSWKKLTSVLSVIPGALLP